MEKRFPCSSEVLQEISKRFNIILISDIAVVAIFTLLMLTSENMKDTVTDMLDTGVGKVIAIAFIALFVKDIWLLIKWNTIRNNVSQCWLKLEDKKVSGVTTDMLGVPGSTRPFEIPIHEVSYTNVLEINVFRRECYTLRIQHRNGTIAIPVENAYQIKKLLEDMKSLEKKDDYRGKANRHQWACSLCGKMIDHYPCKYCNANSDKAVSASKAAEQLPPRQPMKVQTYSDGNVMCPVCRQVQKSGRTVCFKCSQPFKYE